MLLSMFHYEHQQLNNDVLTRHMNVKHRCPQWQQSQNMAKISKSYSMTLKCEQHLDELIL